MAVVAKKPGCEAGLDGANPIELTGSTRSYGQSQDW